MLGATGMVGQRFISLLSNHPWFEICVIAASHRSAGKLYEKAVENRWKMAAEIPNSVKNMKLLSAEEDFGQIVDRVDFVFSALDMEKEKTKAIEEQYAAAGKGVISNNSAHRWTEDVPMIMPELNPDQIKLIDIQKKKRSWDKGFIVVKPNCSLQSYLPIVYALWKYDPLRVSVTTLQAISGAGKTFHDWPEMVDNVIPFINGEEEKTEKEPLKILGLIKNGQLILSKKPTISATCIRVAASTGHMASVAIKFQKKPTLNQVVDSIRHYKNPLDGLMLPSAPKQFIHYFSQDDRPQTRLDREVENGMAIACGRFRHDPFFDWKFICLSHNTIRGAAGGAILTAELLKAKGYL